MIINVSTLYNVKISCSLPVLMMQYGTLSLKDIAVITRKQPFAHHYDGAWLILIGSLWVRILAGGNHRMKAAPLPPPCRAELYYGRVTRNSVLPQRRGCI